MQTAGVCWATDGGAVGVADIPQPEDSEGMAQAASQAAHLSAHAVKYSICRITQLLTYLRQKILKAWHRRPLKLPI